MKDTLYIILMFFTKDKTNLRSIIILSQYTQEVWKMYERVILNLPGFLPGVGCISQPMSIFHMIFILCLTITQHSNYEQ